MNLNKSDTTKPKIKYAVDDAASAAVTGSAAVAAAGSA